MLEAKFSVPHRVQPEDEIVHNFQGSFNTERDTSRHQTIDSKVGFRAVLKCDGQMRWRGAPSLVLGTQPTTVILIHWFESDISQWIQNMTTCATKVSGAKNTFERIFSYFTCVKNTLG